jgi:hypothetical protein
MIVFLVLAKVVVEVDLFKSSLLQLVVVGVLEVLQKTQ